MSSSPIAVEDAITVVHAARRRQPHTIVVMTMSALAFWPDVTEHDFRLIGTMGAAGAIGLGLALGVPDRPVWILDGDGSLLMQLGVTATIADAAPRNLVHVVIDNGIYAVSGGQPTPGPDDWPALLEAAGYREAIQCDTRPKIGAALERSRPGPRAIVIRCRRERPAYAPGALAVDAAAEAARLRAALAP